MTDRLPPSWGHEPEDGRALDALLTGEGLAAEAPLSAEEILADEALLAGQLACVSDAQRPVAGAMFALRSAAEESELAGEEAARAAFRGLLTPGGRDSQHTLVLPIQSAGQGQGARSPAHQRHRHRRRAVSGPAGWRVMALAGSAAAVVAVGAAALAGAFSGSAGRGETANPTAAQLSTPSPSQTQRVLGGGQPTQDATPSTTPKVSAAPGTTTGQGTSQTPADLCREYFAFFVPGSRGDHTKEREIFEQLTVLAGGQDKVFGYCVQQVHAGPPPPPGQAPPGGGSPPTGPHPGDYSGHRGSEGRPGGSR